MGRCSGIERPQGRDRNLSYVASMRSTVFLPTCDRNIVPLWTVWHGDPAMCLTRSVMSVLQ